MRKVKKDEITRIKNLLNKILAKSPTSNYSKVVIGFPIDSSFEKSIDGFSITGSNKEAYGKEKKPEAMVCYILDDSQDFIRLGYGDTTFSKKFDFLSFCDLFGLKVPKGEISFLEEIDCVLLEKENLFFTI